MKVLLRSQGPPNFHLILYFYTLDRAFVSFSKWEDFFENGLQDTPPKDPPPENYCAEIWRRGSRLRMHRRMTRLMSRRVSNSDTVEYSKLLAMIK